MKVAAILLLVVLQVSGAFQFCSAARNYNNYNNNKVEDGKWSWNWNETLASAAGHAAVVLAGGEGEPSYPLYKQCDSRWGSELIYTKTVCQVGCLMSSISMGLSGWKISVAGNPSNPGTLNSWLKENSGYTTGNDLIEDALNALVPGIWSSSGMHKKNDISPETLLTLFDNSIVVANVMHGRHFVLATSWSPSDPDTLGVNDPGFSTTSYSLEDDVVGWRVFTMLDSQRGSK